MKLNNVQARIWIYVFQLQTSDIFIVLLCFAIIVSKHLEFKHMHFWNEGIPECILCYLNSTW